MAGRTRMSQGVTMKLKLICVTASLAVAVVNAHAANATAQQTPQDIVRGLHWIRGPTQVRVGTTASFNVPASYVYLEQADTVRMMAVMQNPPEAGETLFAPDDLRWFGVFEYRDTGHVPDDDNIDASAVLNSIRAGTEEANKQRTANGWPPIQIVGWRYAPFYDPATKRLDWATDIRASGGQVVNYDTRILGRTGVTSATLIVDPLQLATSVAEFKTAISGYQYLPDQNYQAFRPGDHVAEYGLAALITGGAAAVAAKTGLWKVILGALAAFWKLVLAGVVAVFAAIGKLFGKRSKS